MRILAPQATKHGPEQLGRLHSGGSIGVQVHEGILDGAIRHIGKTELYETMTKLREDRVIP